MTEDQLIESVFEKEGVTYGDQHTHPPIDQPTAAGGITLPVLNEYYTATGVGRAATVEDLKALTKVTAAPVVRWDLRRLSSDQHFDQIMFEPLRLQMIDFAYNSGAKLAIKWLQRVLRIPRQSVDGVIGPKTLAALEMFDPWLVNQALVGARLQMIDMWTDADAQRKAWEEGLESRGLLFSLLDV